jgi:hypothetical protein
VLDESKPYVYLQFGHVGPRQPYQSSDGSAGLWIRVVNNCRVPIVFSGVNAPPGTPGVILYDDVVEQKQFLDVYSRSDKKAMAERRNRARLRRSMLRRKPAGYTAEVRGIIRVQPGQIIEFSVPRNHVAEFWHLQVKFALDIQSWSVAAGPFTYLTFSEHDIPEEVRRAEHISSPR